MHVNVEIPEVDTKVDEEGDTVEVALKSTSMDWRRKEQFHLCSRQMESCVSIVITLFRVTPRQKN